jgi:CHAD domain-containing protein
MSAPHKSKPCKSDEDYCRFGSETLSRLLQAFKEQIGGVIENEDIEYVHKMRVTSRRIRAALPLFRICYPKKKFKKWLRNIKNITRLLGEARDLDVQIAFAKAYNQKLNQDEAAGLEPLLKIHRIRRNAIQATVALGLEELQSSAVLEEMAESFRSIK